jgi:hypothetical protein
MTPTPTPFWLRIFVVDGDPDGLRLVDRSNWNGKALMFPRALYPKVRERAEFRQTGVYLLFGPRTDGDGEMLYVGEGDPVRPRFEDHYARKDFWTHGAFFVAGGQLNKAHVQFLEAQLILRAKEAKRALLDNSNTPTEPTLSEADRADMEVFLQHILEMLPLLGVHAFEQSPLTTRRNEGPALTCKGRGVEATGYDTPQGFVVRSGSLAAKDEVPSLGQHFPRASEHRAVLAQNGVLVADGPNQRFAQDFTFSSPSAAATIVLGRAANGRTEWKDANGKTLKQLQEAQLLG